MLYIGTSGFSYTDWVGPFYPEKTKREAMFSIYTQQFNAVEINFSYYRIPSAAILNHLQRQVSADFRFVIKANQKMTHTRTDNLSIFREFKASLQPLADSGRLGCILAQFPFAFHLNEQNQKYLEYLREQMNDFPLVIEFRNINWIKEKTFDFLKKNNLGFCVVDQPSLPGLIPPVTVTTSDLGYIRFHGRNKEKWWKPEQAYERYDYLYREEELRSWIPKIKQMMKQTRDQYIFMNNHYRGKAVKNALMLAEMLRQGTGSAKILNETRETEND